MKLLFVSDLDRYSRAIRTITKYVEVGKKLGHDVALFSEERSEPPLVPTSLNPGDFDFVIFVVYHTSDFPDLPYLANLLDGIPKERRVIIDCCGRYNDTVRIEHDFNHLEKLDGHQGWEWIEGFDAVSYKILQPTLSPRRSNVRSFLFHGFDPANNGAPSRSAEEGSAGGSASDENGKAYDLVYVGNNWQRWSQIKPLLESVASIRDRLGRIALVGWDWDKRPDWAEQLGLQGADVDPDFLTGLNVETQTPVPYDEVINFVSKARFSPVIHRPLYKELGIVTNRTFEMFTSEAIPILMLPEELIVSVYGESGLTLKPSGDVGEFILDAKKRPEHYWGAVSKVRNHLNEHHSYEKRFRELVSILND